MVARAPFLKTRFGGYYHRDLPREDTELTHVGPGTPCGEYMRRFWQPVCFLDELKDLPQKVRILGEDLVVFRDQSGDEGIDPTVTVVGAGVGDEEVVVNLKGHGERLLKVDERDLVHLQLSILPAPEILSIRTADPETGANQPSGSIGLRRRRTATSSVPVILRPPLLRPRVTAS